MASEWQFITSVQDGKRKHDEPVDELGSVEKIEFDGLWWRYSVPPRLDYLDQMLSSSHNGRTSFLSTRTETSSRFTRSQYISSANTIRECGERL